MVMNEDEIRAMANDDGQIYIPVSSSFIEAISYDLEVNVLIVSFLSGNDTAYTHCSFEKFVDFVNGKGTGGSVGAYYNLYIK